jgi:hypothetical protein
MTRLPDETTEQWLEAIKDDKEFRRRLALWDEQIAADEREWQEMDARHARWESGGYTVADFYDYMEKKNMGFTRPTDPELLKRRLTDSVVDDILNKDTTAAPGNKEAVGSVSSGIITNPSDLLNQVRGLVDQTIKKTAEK